jgi:hypothetical protein
MRDIISKLDKILSEEATLQDLKKMPAAQDPVIKKAIADKEKEHVSPSGVKTNMEPTDDDYEINYGKKGLAGKDTANESTFVVGDDFGISFSEDLEISTEIVGFVADGIVIDLDDAAMEMLTNEGLSFLEGELVEGVAGPKSCWKGYRKVGTKPGTGKNAGKRVNDCEKIGEDLDESGLQYYTGKKKYGKDGMSALAQAGRDGASEEELGKIKDKFKKEDHSENPEDPENYAEYDNEGDMAKDDLRTINDAAQELYDILDTDDNLPEWVQSKITKAMDYIDTARDYMKANNYDENVDEAEYHGKNVPLGKKLPGDVKKSKVYVRKPNGKIVKVNFGDKKMRIKKSNPARRKSFRARHNCKNPGPRWKARYWSCRSW